MLIEFSVKNFKSIKESATFSMLAAKIKSKEPDIDKNNVFHIDDLSLLKSAAIYGANASGKSNFCEAFHFMRHFVMNSSKETQIKERIPIEPFRLDPETAKQPSFFEILFLLDGKKYRYGFEVSSREVVSEWLYYVPTIREARLFERKGSDIELSSSFKEGRGLREKTRNNALFLSVAAQFNGAVSQQILLWFRSLNVISGLDDNMYRAYTVESFKSAEDGKAIIKFVKELDLGIDDIQIEEVSLTPDVIPQNLPEDIRKRLLSGELKLPSAVRTIHRVYNSENQQLIPEVFDLDEHESEGTKKLFSLAGPLLDTLKNGRILLIDELDARLHPKISCSIIHLFNSNETNRHNAQLIFTTHDTNLLSSEIFRRDQLWFAEKNRQGATDIYSLVEFKLEGKSKVRNDASYENDYIHGKYGAIPFIGDFSRLFGEADGKNTIES